MVSCTFNFQLTTALVVLLYTSAAIATTTAESQLRQRGRTATATSPSLNDRRYLQTWWHAVVDEPVEENIFRQSPTPEDEDLAFPKEESEDENLESDRTFHCGEWGELVFPADMVEGEDGIGEESPCRNFPREDSQEDYSLHEADPPTVSPTVEPTPAPTKEPTEPPTPLPTVEPTDGPTAEPTDAPSQSPVLVPTVSPVDLGRSMGPPPETRAADPIIEADPVQASEGVSYVPFVIGGVAVVAVVGVALGLSKSSATAAAGAAGTTVVDEEGAENVFAEPAVETPQDNVFDGDDAEVDV